MKNCETGINVFQKIIDRPKDEEDPNKEKVWDGFRWVVQEKKQETKSFDILKPGKSVQIANIPLQYNIPVSDFIEFIIENMKDKNVISSKELSFLKDKLITALDLNEKTNSGVITMNSESIAKRMILLDGIVLLGCTLRFSPYIETKYEENTHKGNIALSNNADISAKSAAVAFAALNSFVNDKKEEIKDNNNKINNTALVGVNNKNTSQVAVLGKFKNIQLNFDSSFKLIPEKIIKVSGILNDRILDLSDEEYLRMKKYLFNEFSKYGNVINMFVVSRRSYVKIGAELGSIFIEFDDIKFSEMAYYAILDKEYEGRKYKLAFMNEIVFYNDILPENKKTEYMKRYKNDEYKEWKKEGDNGKKCKEELKNASGKNNNNSNTTVSNEYRINSEIETVD